MTKDKYEKPEIATEFLEPGILLCSGSDGELNFSAPLTGSPITP
jgi:hypothetical protein